ncbi:MULTISPECIES: long-chain-fatty-acid--CoA ligase [unclassified Hyphomonas]|jgi:fatty-acyl-CoA synthase|uniref:Medium-chain-fatty-acid--CoA ligase n=6 Tax=root TaxID=1 RepID=A0A160U2J5_9ZZZZ|nr:MULTISPECIES: long-chain-fatty-acid--CoA ligase [unclassified Hyphomonas]MAN91938.1 long-chain fatty acid--CoA ligase [Hyphomonadaceae bacterium]MAA82003.1 long-chain fatty acid--CoA ligase [Hyphomonas sp.]MAL45249.1 long-chain fatty acid--CoA ligase [Hyphomonas sp.]MAX83532.1 long-chain fatty acid--CoA ligase [Hyphomonas sp.]MBG68173.1 long-chain fatty acid--CoA ligase [Hyphomonas sp.]|tara:strand:- start:6366 stop:7991 length:1626 start_codon:yes stop_codon:yes gene_type:complete
MLGIMQDWPLTVNKILEHAKRINPTREIITRRVEGHIVRTTYANLFDQSKQVSNALIDSGIQLGDRVATLGWNSERHMASWYGAMGIGAVLHTINPRLHPEQVAWIANHAEDKVLIFDKTFLPIVEAIKDHLQTVKTFVIYADADTMPENSLGAIPFDIWIDGRSTEVRWGDFPEDTACGLCYTSGTTGDPKGVLYSHRSNVLHTLITMGKDVMGMGADDVVLPVVPMFHANAWGLALSCPAVGSNMVMPGAQMDGASIYELLDTEKVTITAAVPTVWLMLLTHLQENNLKLPHLKKVLIGGSAIPEKILRAFEQDYEVDVVHAWGMTETSPLGTLGALPPHLVNADIDTRMEQKLKQGRPPFGVELKIVDDEGKVLPNDGETSGRLMVSGAAIAAGYFKGVGGDVLDEDGYFDTGDVANIDEYGTMTITDRAKDVIKSGGEWISSIDIENIAVGHPKVANAAAIGIYHPKWDERPLLVVQAAPGETPSKEDVLAQLEGKIAKWWTPDDVVFVDEIPLGATGKINKLALRNQFKDYKLPTA